MNLGQARPPQPRESGEQRLCRYGLAVALVALAFVLRMALRSAIGIGGSFGLFFGAVALSSLLGVGPGLLALVLSLPIGMDAFAMRGHTPGQAALQALVFAVDGLGVIYLSAVSRRAVRAWRRFADRLRESEERFRLTFEDAPIGMALVSLDRRFMRVNRRLCEIVGYSPEELQRMRLDDITHREDVAGDVARFDELTRGKISRVRVEKRYVRKDGRIVEVLVRAAILRDARGQPLFHIAQMEDIGVRKRVERQQVFLSESGAVLSSSLDYEQTLATIGRLVVREFADVCIVDIRQGGDGLRLKVVAAEPKAAPICERLERLPLDRTRPYLAAEALEARRAVLIPPERLEVLAQSPEHLRLLRDLGLQAMMAAPLLARSQLLGALVFISTRSSRTYGEAELGFAQALADRAALAIDNGRLYRAALRAKQARDEVLGVVAHDLRNPLSTLLMQSALQRPKPGQPDRRDPRPGLAIRRAVQKMNRLIQDLLDVTALEAGKVSFERARVPAERLLTQVMEAQGPRADAVALHLRVERRGGLPDVWGDEQRLLQVLENLVGNALKFTPTGGRVTLGAGAAEGPSLLLWVRDTGPGIAAEDIPHLFDRFWQVRRGDRRGAGLGLSIAHGIVEAHGGHIWVESALGKGSTFFVALPVASQADAHPGGALPNR